MHGSFDGGSEMSAVLTKAYSACSHNSIERFMNQMVRWRMALLIGALALFLAPAAMGQGCVAAHSPQPLIANTDQHENKAANNRHQETKLEKALHNLSVTIGYREYNSFRHFVGTVEQLQREVNHNQVQNHVDLFDAQISYKLTPRWSLLFDVPALAATRQQQG